MFHIIKLPRAAKREQASASPGNALGACRTLGIRVRGRDFRLLDRETLLYDARVAYKREIKLCHTDLGGDPARCRAVVEAYRLLKRYCTRAPYTVPSDPRYVEKVAKQDFLDSL